jgi:uncharacterized coiled-coil protein SlyX
MDPNLRIDELERLVAAKDATIADLTAKLQAIEARITAMQRRIFGRSSEQLHDPGQQALDFLTRDVSSPFVDAAATAEVPAATTSETTADTDAAAVPAQRRKRGKRLGRLPDHVEVTERIIDVPEAERLGADGQPLVRLTDEITERLDYVPSHYRRLRSYSPMAPAPPSPAGSMPAATSTKYVTRSRKLLPWSGASPCSMP